MQTRNQSNVILTELVIVVLFFSFIGVTITQMFVATHQRSRENERTQRALLLAQDCLELLFGQENPEALLAAEGYEPHGETAWELEVEGAFRVVVDLWEIQESEAGRLWTGRVSVKEPAKALPSDARDKVYAYLPLRYYVPFEEVVP